MLEAREKSANLEYEIFMRIREEVSKYIQRLQASSSRALRQLMS